jgi:hypothetical protein
MQQFQTNNLLTNVNISILIKNNDTKLLYELISNLISLMTDINRIILFHTKSISFLQKENVKSFFTSARVLHAWSLFLRLKLKEFYLRSNIGIQWLCHWLYTPRGDGKARVLVLYPFENEAAIMSLIEQIKKVWMESILII